MLPLDVALSTPEIDPETLELYLNKLADINIHGVMVDVWWGICEPSPGEYDFSCYVHLAKICLSAGLKLQAVMSFHACGGNIGDAVNIPLPEWVLDAGDIHKFWFVDRTGNENREYISFGADHEPVLPVERTYVSAKQGERMRTPMQAYTSFINAFVSAMQSEGLMGRTVTELQVGLGPCGELRYPSYPLSRWAFPGIGEFQCFDRYLLSDLSAAVRRNGSLKLLPSELPPKATGSYNDVPMSTAFFKSNMFSSTGSFFLEWYSSQLLRHATDLLQEVRCVIPKNEDNVRIAIKISGVHWWKLSKSRAAEATCGYISSSGRPIYNDIAKLLRVNNATLDFTCLEMRTIDQPMKAYCGPRQLVAEVFNCAFKEGIAVAGENALQDFGEKAFGQIVYSMDSTRAKKVSFTLLRLCHDLMSPENFNRLQKLAKELQMVT